MYTNVEHAKSASQSMVNQVMGAANALSKHVFDKSFYFLSVKTYYFFRNGIVFKRIIGIPFYKILLINIVKFFLIFLLRSSIPDPARPIIIPGFAA